MVLFYRHVETLFDHRIGVANVGAWADFSLRSMLVVIGCSALGNEPFLSCSEHHTRYLKLLGGPSLAHGVWTLGRLQGLLFVETRPWHLQLKTSAKEGLIVGEAGRCRIESNWSAANRFIVTGPGATILPDIRIETADLVFYSKRCLVEGLFTVRTLRDNLSALAPC